MKKIASVFLLLPLLVTGCGNIQGSTPSFNDTQNSSTSLLGGDKKPSQDNGEKPSKGENNKKPVSGVISPENPNGATVDENGLVYGSKEYADKHGLMIDDEGKMSMPEKFSKVDSLTKQEITELIKSETPTKLEKEARILQPGDEVAYEIVNDFQSARANGDWDKACELTALGRKTHAHCVLSMKENFKVSAKPKVLSMTKENTEVFYKHVDSMSISYKDKSYEDSGRIALVKQDGIWKVITSL